MTIEAAEGAVVFEANPAEIRRTRDERRQLWYINWSMVIFLLTFPIIGYVVRIQGGQDILRSYAAFVLPMAVLAGGNWFVIRPGILRINRVAVCERGLYPPIKSKKRLVRDDWFVPFKDITSMEPVEERVRPGGALGFIPFYNIVLRDGTTIQLNVFDLLAYVDEREVRRYEKILRIVERELSSAEDQPGTSAGHDILIPRQKYEAMLLHPLLPLRPTWWQRFPVPWYWPTLGMVMVVLLVILIVALASPILILLAEALLLAASLIQTSLSRRNPWQGKTV